MPKQKNRPKSGKKRKLQKDEPQGPRYALAKTANGRMLQRALDGMGVDPRQYKSWVMFTTGRMIDWVDAYNVVGKDGPLQVDGVKLIHKRELHKTVPKPMADNFWNASLGRRVSQKGPPG
jgi:hypothetical protein